MLRRWWTQKYRLPPTSDEYQRYTVEELWVEFWEDHYAAHPEERTVMDENENVQFVTGDEDIDGIEKRIATGDLSDEDLVKELEGWEKEDGNREEVGEPAINEEDIEFEDSYVG